jgi:peroxiredoxin-like protein
MAVFKEFQYPVAVRWEHDRLVRAAVEGKTTLVVGPPADYPGGELGVWNPEELLVGAVATCFAITFAALARRAELDVHGLDVHATGHVSRRDDGRFGFVAIELSPRILVEEECLARARAIAVAAEQRCLVAAALDVPVHVKPTVAAASASLA